MTRKGLMPANLEITLSHPLGASEEDGTVATIEITDRDSLKTIALFEFTAEGYHAFMASRTRGEFPGHAYLAKVADLNKLGNRRVMISRTFTKLPYREDMAARLDTWAQDAARWLGSDEGRWSRSNTGAVTVSVALYIGKMLADDPEGMEAYRLRQQEILGGVSARTLGVEDEA